MTPTCCFAIVPDGYERPAAIFEALEDALEWALARFGADTFTIRRVDAMLDQSEPPARASAVA